MKLKRSWILLAAVLLLTAIFAPATYAEGVAAAAAKTIEITGTGRVAYSYDQAEITLGVSELADSPTAAFKAMSEKINKVVAAAKAKGIAEADLKTGYLNLHQEYDWKDGTQILRGYRANNTLTIKVKDLARVPEVMEAAVEAGANTVQGVNFSLSKPEALQEKATDAAIESARAQADRAAKRLGLSVIGVQKVYLMGQGAPMPIPYAKMAMDQAGGGIFAGQGEYAVSVNVVYEIGAAGSAASQSAKSIDITGVGRVAYAYDEAQITLGVSELGDSPTKAFKAMNEKINKVVATTKAKGINDSSLQTGYLSLNPEYDWKESGQVLRGYRATNSVTIKVKELAQVPAIMEAAVSAGANQVQGVNFSLSNPDSLQGDATDAAIDNARAQAEHVAKKLGLKVSGVQKVQVANGGSNYGGPLVIRNAVAESAAAPPAVFSGQGEYISSVSISFELQ